MTAYVPSSILLPYLILRLGMLEYRILKLGMLAMDHAYGRRICRERLSALTLKG